MTDLTSGFGRLSDEISFDEIHTETLSATCDRFYEARFFEQLVRRVQADIDHVAIVNWLVSSHVTAAIAIHDAAKADFRRLGLTDHFIRSDLAREFFLRSDDPDPNYRDPLAVNRAYRDLRNLRVHHGKSLVLLRTRVLEADIAENPSVPLNGGEPRWFLKPLDAEDRRLLAKPHITGSERDRFHEWVDTRPLATVLCQHLVVLADAIKRTERTLERVSVQRQPRPKR